MKFSRKTYFSFFFLLCFTASFSLTAAHSFLTPVHKGGLSHGKSASLSDREEQAASGSSFILEKNENETEKSLSAQSFLLPFLISYVHSEVCHTAPRVSCQPAETRTAAIYLALCNFRI